MIKAHSLENGKEMPMLVKHSESSLMDISQCGAQIFRDFTVKNLDTLMSGMVMSGLTWLTQKSISQVKLTMLTSTELDHTDLDPQTELTSLILMVVQPLLREPQTITQNSPPMVIEHLK